MLGRCIRSTVRILTFESIMGFGGCDLPREREGFWRQKQNVG